MEINMDHNAARDLLVSVTKPVSAEKIRLEEAAGRILARQLTAASDVPAFDRSPYDGYAFRAEDTKGASREYPVILKILEEVPAGSIPSKQVVRGTAAKIFTGALIPEGADAVIMYEKTDFDTESVTIYEEAHHGDNIIYAGEDVRKGSLLAKAGSVIDAGLCGTLASQGYLNLLVYAKPVVGIISTGNELVDPEDKWNVFSNDRELPDGDGINCTAFSSDIKKGSRLPESDSAIPPGKIINSNRYTLAAALWKDGCIPVYLGTAGDDVPEIAALISAGFTYQKKRNTDGSSSIEQQGSSLPRSCDMILLTGGVSAGDYDLTPEAMGLAGCNLLAKGVKLKPGMACSYGEKDGKLVCALSGNPASALTNYYAVVRPAVRKMTGLADYMPKTFTVTLAQDFNKKSKMPRILKGRVEISDRGEAILHIPEGQGNTMLSSSIGCNCMAEVNAGSGPVAAGTSLQAFTV